MENDMRNDLRRDPSTGEPLMNDQELEDGSTFNVDEDMTDLPTVRLENGQPFGTPSK